MTALFSLLFLGSVAIFDDCQLEKTESDVFLKFGSKLFSLPEVSPQSKIEKCSAQSDYLLVELDRASGEMLSNVQERDLLIFNLKESDAPVLKENIFSQRIMLENGNPVKEIVKREYSFHKTKKGANEVRLTNPSKTISLK